MHIYVTHWCKNRSIQPRLKWGIAMYKGCHSNHVGRKQQITHCRYQIYLGDRPIKKDTKITELRVIHRIQSLAGISVNPSLKPGPEINMAKNIKKKNVAILRRFLEKYIMFLR